MEEIFVPASGMAMEDVLFSEWLKQPGDKVAAGEAVAVVETDKATVELSGLTAGRLSRHLVEAGTRVAAGSTVAFVLAEGESEPGASSAGTGALLTSPVDNGADNRPAPPSPTAPVEREVDGRHALSPRQRRAMAEAASAAGVAPSAVAAAPSAVAAAPSTVAAAPSAPRPNGAAAPSANREATAALVSESWRTVPHFSVGRDLRVDGMADAVAAVRATGAAVTVTDFLALGMARALGTVGEAPDVGLAVATDWGVLIPVLRSLATSSLPEVAALRQAAVDRARARRLSTVDTGPVFATLSNLGAAGVTWFTGVVPLNQVLLLTVGEVSLRPAVQDGGLVAAPMMTAVVTADHRRYDGVDSARFLDAFGHQLGELIGEAQR